MPPSPAPSRPAPSRAARPPRKDRRLKFGILYNVDYHPEVHGTPQVYYELILGQVELLERLGYDSVWFSEHHCSGYSFGHPAVIASAAAMRTSRIRLGTGVSLVALHHPMQLAEEYAMVDNLSGGRLEFGVGRGFLMQEYHHFGIPIDESHGRYRERTDLITAAWTATEPLGDAQERVGVGLGRVALLNEQLRLVEERRGARAGCRSAR